MNKLALTGSAVALFLGTHMVFAQAPADEHAGHHQPGAVTPASPPDSRPPTQGMGPAAMPQMQGNMQKMRDLMTKIHASKNPAERQQLLQQHSKAMQDQMGMMHGMGSGQGGMMGGGMKMGGGMQGGTSPPANGGLPKGDGKMSQDMMDHQAMQTRMDMMQMMMEQMLQHQGAQLDAKPAK